MQKNATLTDFVELKPIVIDHNKRMKTKPIENNTKEAQDKVLTWFF